MSKTLKQRQQETGRTLALDGLAWRKLRALVLAKQPLCVHCLSRAVLTEATDVDHADNDPTNNYIGNLQSLCKSCHSRKTARDMGKRVPQPIGLDGWPL